MRKILLTATLLAVSILTALGQGSTTSNIGGRVVDDSGESLPGATVIAVHNPTGTQYGIVSDAQGYFRLSNLRPGGPYTVTINFVGYSDFIKTEIYLQLGQTFNIAATMSEEAIEIAGVTITATRNDIFDGNRTGATSVVSEELIDATPNIARAIGDFARFDPMANISEGNDGFSISLNGMNNRYNAIYINGAVSNDVFGLAGSGTNGGQTGVSPVSIDAIEEYQIQVAPFDIKIGGFGGGAINAVTRTGSNEVEGSAYYFFRNEGFAGKTPTDDESATRESLADFSAQTYGLRVGGPLKRDKLFFFVSAELQRDEVPQPFSFADYTGDASRADLDALENKLSSEYGYDPGGFEDNATFLDSEKIFGRLDWNINDKHKLYFSYNFVNAENVESVQSNDRNIRYYNSSEFFPTTTNTGTLELNSIFERSANTFRTTFTSVRDDRDQFGDPFPYVAIDDGSGLITFGSEQFSTANRLDQDVITVTNNFEIFRGPHTITIGANFEYFDAYNLFIRQNFGVYEYNSLNDFMTDQNAREFFRSYSLVDDVVGDESTAAAIFSTYQLGFYIQDEFQLNENVKLTGGLRYDIYAYPDNTPENPEFNNTTVPLIEAEGYDLKGATTGMYVDTQGYFSPRFGFNWDLKGDQTSQIRGGLGVFVSRAPLVWPGGAYNNNGRSVGGDFTTAPTTGWFRDFNGVFNPDINSQPQRVAPNSGLRSGQIDLFASDFRLPSFAKYNIALDQKLPGGLIGTFEFVYNKTLNNVFYENINLRPSSENVQNGPDNRPFYDRSDEIDDTYGRILLGSNTDLGYSWNGNITLTRPFDNGFFTSLSYSYGDSWTIYDGTSSQNSSQWRGQHSIQGRNYFPSGPTSDDLQRSDFAMGSRFLWTGAYRLEYGNNFASTITLIWEGTSGTPYSYIYNDNGNLNREDSRERNLIFVPATQADINLVDDGSRTAAQQWAELDEFIENDEYLSERRGQYAERNQNRTPFESVVDLKFIQDFFMDRGNGKKHTFQFTIDIYNFSNLLNKDWGRRYNSSFGGWQLINYEGGSPSAPEFTFPETGDPYFIDDSGLTSSRWQMQMGLRYIF